MFVRDPSLGAFSGAPVVVVVVVVVAVVVAAVVAAAAFHFLESEASLISSEMSHPTSTASNQTPEEEEGEGRRDRGAVTFARYVTISEAGF